MEWVETTARTVSEAKDLALDQLGVDEDDAEFEVLEEPRPGLFGRVRGEARVRARVRPSRPRPKLDRRERRRRDVKAESAPAAADASSSVLDPVASDASSGGPDPAVAAVVESALDAADAVAPTPATATGLEAAVASHPDASGPAVAAPAAGGGVSSGGKLVRPSRRRGAGAVAAEVSTPAAGDEAVEGGGEPEGAVTPESVGPAAVAFLEGLAAAFGLEATAETRGEDDDIEVRLNGRDLGLLIGPRGQTLLAIQDLARTVSQRGVTGRSRLHVDIGGYRERRRDALARFTADVARQVIDSGVPRMLEPMASVDRKVVHDTASGIEGVETRSEGEEPTRRVVILPAPDAR